MRRDKEIKMLFEPFREKLVAMCTASLESVFWRQDKYNTGGIVESDERVDEGRKLYWPWCWPRNFIVEPLLKINEFERVRKHLDFWYKCQRPDGNWLHCYDVRDGSEYPGIEETDNVGYMLWHTANYIKACDDQKWLSKNYSSIEKAGNFLIKNFNSDLSLIYGKEECEIPGANKFSSAFSLHINCVCAKGLYGVAFLAEKMNVPEAGEKFRFFADKIVNEGIKKNLWDATEKTFVFGYDKDAKTRITASVLWLTLIPLWILDDFNFRAEEVLEFHRKKLYNKDPEIRNTYWLYDLSSQLKSGLEIENKYSGYGVWIGGLPVLIDAAIKAGDYKHAKEQLEKMIQFTNPENLLIPEHVNTIADGQLGNYSSYPDPYYYVDSGNLLHLSFLLTLIARYDIEILEEAKEKI